MRQNRTSAIGMVIASCLLVVTMVLHPSGGNIDRILATIRIIVISHSIAIVAMPILIACFKELANILKADQFITRCAFVTSIVALGAGVLAAAINGLALPIFVMENAVVGKQDLATVRIVLRSFIAFNHAFDYILIGGLCLSTLFWSLRILQSRLFSVWCAYVGIAWTLISMLMLITGFELLTLDGFRVFIAGQVVWFICIAVSMYRLKAEDAVFAAD
jgi:hypothetical protein